MHGYSYSSVEALSPSVVSQSSSRDSHYESYDPSQ